MTNPNSPCSLVRRPIFITGLVAALAAGIGTGCSTSNSKYGWNNNTQSYSANSMAAMSNAQIDPNATRGQFDSQWFQQRANEVQLPAVWVSEASHAIHEMEGRRAQIEAQRISEFASRSEKLAYADAQMEQAFVRETIGFADAQMLQDKFDAKLSELDILAMSQEQAIEEEARYNDAMVRTTVQERQAEFEKLRSSATSEFDQAQALHQRMLAERIAVSDSGWATIGEMTKIADMTEARASSKAKALRTAGKTLLEQTSARVDELNELVSNNSQQTSTSIASLREQASTLKSQAFADANELLAQAEQIENTDHEAMYELTLEKAEQAFAKAKSESASHQSHAEAMLTEVEAELTRRRADAVRFLGVAEADLYKSQQEIQTVHQSAIAEVEMLRTFAETLELEAKAQFIAAEASATAGAKFEQAMHQDEIAQKQFETIKAQAEADASQMKAEISRQIAQQLASGNVTLPEFVDPQNPMSSFEEFKTASSDVEEVPAAFEPAHIAHFKTTLAKSAMVSAKADALYAAGEASFEENNKKLGAWWTQKQAMHDRFLAEADAMEQKSIAKAEQMTAEAESMMSIGQAQFDRGLAEAEAIRKDAFAMATSYRAKSKSIREKAEASSAQFLSQANAFEKAGAAEAKSLQVQMESAKVRGEAKSREFFAEADAIEQGQAAVVAQMRQEIRSSEQVLRAELVRLDQSAESFIQIAEATYQEAKTIADTFDTKTSILQAQMQADSEADFRFAMAGVEHLRNVTSAQEVAAQAHVERAVAQAELTRSGAEFDDSIRRASIESQSQIANAEMEAHTFTADAMDTASVALFEARIAGVTADRDRAFAKAYLSDQSQIARRNQAVAAANAYREISSAAVAKLNSTKFDFEQAASVNWDSRLAIPGALTQQDLDGSKWLLENASFDVDIAGVPSFED